MQRFHEHLQHYFSVLFCRFIVDKDLHGYQTGWILLCSLIYNVVFFSLKTWSILIAIQNLILKFSFLQSNQNIKYLYWFLWCLSQIRQTIWGLLINNINYQIIINLIISSLSNYFLYILNYWPCSRNEQDNLTGFAQPVKSLPLHMFITKNGLISQNLKQVS